MVVVHIGLQTLSHSLAGFAVFGITKRPLLMAGVPFGRNFQGYFGDSVFEAGPVGPAVVLGFVSGVPFAPPLSVISDPPPDDIPVVPDFFMAWEFVFVMLGLLMSCWAAGRLSVHTRR